MIEPPVEDPDMWSEELVGRHGEEVATKRLNINRHVRAGVNRIDKHHGARFMGGDADRRNIDQSPQRVGGKTDCDQSNSVVEQIDDRLRVEHACGRIELGQTNLHSVLFGGSNPRCVVGIVIEAGHDDGIARVPGAGEGTAQGEGEAGHVLAEDDLTGVGIEEVGHRLPAGCGDLVRCDRGAVSATEVADAVFENRCHRVDDDLRHLGSAGPVEIGDLPSVLASVECRKPGANLLDWEHW